jgi:CheY-like chemotaxis protein
MRLFSKPFIANIFRHDSKLNGVNIHNVEYLTKRFILSTVLVTAIVIITLTVFYRLYILHNSLLHELHSVILLIVFVTTYIFSRSKRYIEKGINILVTLGSTFILIRHIQLYNGAILPIYITYPAVLVIVLALKGKLWGIAMWIYLVLVSIPSLHHTIKSGNKDYLFVMIVALSWSTMLIFIMSAIDWKTTVVSDTLKKYEQHRVSEGLIKRLYHEIFNPLNIAMGYLSSTMKSSKSKDDHKYLQKSYHALERIESNMRKMAVYMKTDNLGKAILDHEHAIDLMKEIKDHSLKLDNATILCVDDSAEIKNLFHEYIKDTNYKLSFATNGLEAIEMVRNHNFDLIIMDIMIPFMDGHTTTHEIREWEKVNNLIPTPILALSSFNTLSDRLKSIDVGCNLHISKPINKKIFLDLVKRYT